ncbi:neurexin-1-alpha [Elysia marginata]|uniref:Neurexin-1-alpha n=1 Tax=Elysia marginata TaxID=1093978 RepID=A0AAV4GGF3_9GAST|nr:neurexin-1-alpha [Elysia marginata]
MVLDPLPGFVSQGRKRGRRYKPHNMLLQQKSNSKVLSFSTKAASFLLISLLLSITPHLAYSQKQIHDHPQHGNNIKYPDSETKNKNKDAVPHQNDSPQLSHETHIADDFDNTWTFFSPDLSYMDFSPVIREDQSQHLSLAFRTQRANGLLLLQHIPGLRDTPMSSVLSEYQLFVELRQGSLRAGLIVNHFQDFITTGKALNNDAWHRIDLAIDVTRREMRLSLDGKMFRETLKAYTWGNAEDILLWSHLKPIVSLGALVVKHFIIQSTNGNIVEILFVLMPLYLVSLRTRSISLNNLAASWVSIRNKGKQLPELRAICRMSEGRGVCQTGRLPGPPDLQRLRGRDLWLPGPVCGRQVVRAGALHQPVHARGAV